MVLVAPVEVLTNLMEEVLFTTLEMLSALTEEVLSSGAKSCAGLLAGII